MIKLTDIVYLIDAFHRVLLVQHFRLIVGINASIPATDASCTDRESADELDNEVPLLFLLLFEALILHEAAAHNIARLSAAAPCPVSVCPLAGRVPGCSCESMTALRPQARTIVSAKPAYHQGGQHVLGLECRRWTDGHAASDLASIAAKEQPGASPHLERPTLLQEARLRFALIAVLYTSAAQRHPRLLSRIVGSRRSSYLLG
jgi:hypothetical protein